MHEMALAEGILQLVEQTARREHAQRVCSVVLQIGRLSAVDPEALKFCFEAVTRTSLAQHAVLQIEPIEGAAWCLECAKTVHISELYSACPDCQGYQLQVTSGTEMRVKEIEIDN